MFLRLHKQSWTEDELVLGPGEVLALYSDGIVERRGEPLDVGIDSLSATLAAGAGMDLLDDLADAIVARHCQGPTDDCCLLILRRSVLGPEPVTSPLVGKL